MKNWLSMTQMINFRKEGYYYTYLPHDHRTFSSNQVHEIASDVAAKSINNNSYNIRIDGMNFLHKKCKERQWIQRSSRHRVISMRRKAVGYLTMSNHCAFVETREMEQTGRGILEEQMKQILNQSLLGFCQHDFKDQNTWTPNAHNFMVGNDLIPSCIC